MERPDIAPLSQLSLGDCFHFAYRAVRDDRGDHVPRFELTEVGKDFCGVRLADSCTANPAASVRLLKTTMVRKLSRPKTVAHASAQSAGAIIVAAVVFDDGAKPALLSAARLLSEKNGRSGAVVSSPSVKL